MGGVADPSNGDVTVNARRLPSGSPVPGVAVVNVLNGIWWVLSGAGGVGDDLLPGKYELEVLQGGSSLRQYVDVAAR